MIRRFCVAILAIALVWVCTNTLFGQSDIIVDIYEPGTAKIKIGVPSFMRDQSASPAAQTVIGEKFSQVVRDDLAFTGLFDVFGNAPRFSQPGPGDPLFAPLKSWAPLDVQSVVHGKFRQTGDTLVFECSLFDVESESRIVGKSYKGTSKNYRSIAHRFADEIVYRYTGKRGIAHASIAYTKGQGKVKEIFIMDYDGRNSYRLTYDNSIALSPEWSPDGKKLVFTSYRDRNPDVYMVGLEDKSYVRVSGFIGLNTSPAFSPDGRMLALTLSKSGNPELYLFEFVTRELTQLTRNPRIDTSPTWSPNGRELAFVSDRSGYPQIYVTDRESVNQRRITYSGYNNTSPAWSPAGDRIAYVSMVSGKGEIYTISPRGAGLQRLTFDGGNEDPSWSPDGQYLAYTAKRGGRKDIYLMRADGSGKRRITFGGGDNMSPAWSP